MAAVSDPIMIASHGGDVGLPAGMAILRGGGSAIDAVEAAVRVVEDSLDEHYVGTGGLPNLLGVVELDASIMDGRTRRAGAVGAVRGFPNPISIARRVMEGLPEHVMLVGEGAERFAEQQGFERAELLTEEAQRLWREGLEQGDGAEVAGDRRYRAAMRARLEGAGDGRLGTVDVIALDRSGSLCVGVSTSGLPWKLPGRLGDSPIIGAGNYCDDRYGGAGCTGRGEVSIRVCTAHSVVRRLAAGDGPVEACLSALAEAASIDDPFRSPLSCVALLPDGRHGAAATNAAEGYRTYAVMTADMDAAQQQPRAVLER
jgi:isoaspartyl peptidase/L-asparaginase-like protein (Ntn-hydrolase superfamily)